MFEKIKWINWKTQKLKSWEAKRQSVCVYMRGKSVFYFSCVSLLTAKEKKIVNSGSNFLYVSFGCMVSIFVQVARWWAKIVCHSIVHKHLCRVRIKSKQPATIVRIFSVTIGSVWVCDCRCVEVKMHCQWFWTEMLLFNKVPNFIANTNSSHCQCKLCSNKTIHKLNSEYRRKYRYIGQIHVTFMCVALLFWSVQIVSSVTNEFKTNHPYCTVTTYTLDSRDSHSLGLM